MIQQGNTLKTCCHQCPQRDYQTRTCPGNRTVSSRRSTWAYIMVSVFLSNGGLDLYTFFLQHREQACVFGWTELTYVLVPLSMLNISVGCLEVENSI